ncbi:MAG: anthranilate synthase component I family protein [Candidatus Symbiothrix sp.]|jgi:anthranilate synthase component 1|nr:anthranilate synthase component I family protein [Candidatus Symbiothrix sp.]
MKKTLLNTEYKTILADLQTPVSIYLKVRDVFPESVLLESSDYHGNENSVSFIGLNPMARFEVKNSTVKLQYPDGTTVEKTVPADTIVDELHQFVHSFDVGAGVKPAPTSDYNGFFGFTAYDAVKYFDTIDPDVPDTPFNASEIPDMIYILYRYTIVVNHFRNELTVIENNLVDETGGNQKSQMDDVLALLNNRNYASYNFALAGEETSTVTDEQYKEMVRQGVKHCKRGDVFQIVLSRCFAQPFAGDDFKVYRALRSINPSPYLFYFDFGSFRIFGSSPETHCGISKGLAYIDPIAGTFRRTGDDEKDKQLAQALLEDPKENAEHVMLVDLARNDLSKNTEKVHVDFYKEVQFYSHVIHLVSRVVGEVRKGTNTIQIYADTFPAGTLSGAPKMRAMELIRDIEPHNRGAYGGCIGYIGLNGDLNQAITIRSFISKNNVLYYQAGAGITARSNDESELQEVNNKLGALKKAIDTAVSIKN